MISGVRCVKVLGAALVLVLVGAGWPASGAVDGQVTTGLVSHVGSADRRPLCPRNGEAFDVVFQTARQDLTEARVGVDEGADGLGVVWVDATIEGSRGEYDLWRASVPATAQSRLSYVIELRDGPDVDYLGASGVAGTSGAAVWWELDFGTLSHAPHGSTPVSGGTVFRVWAPNATTAHVQGAFNNWSLAHPMTRLGDDFVRFVAGADEGDQYKYLFDGTHQRPDARARWIAETQDQNSVILDPLGYQWSVPDFTARPAEEWVVYQLHVGTFAGRNDPQGPTALYSRYRDVAARVGHLAELGVNAVMLNPINEFPGRKSGGYNSISMYAFEGTYGSPDDLKMMVDALHAEGIAVILDVVWNHFPGGDGVFLWDYDGTQIYFDSPPVGTPWGPQADMDRAEVSDYFFDSVETVMGEYRMDGYRHDAIYELVSATQWQPGQALVRDSMDFIRRRHGDAHVIGEIYNNSAWNTSPSGIDLDGQYHEAFKNAISDAVDAAAFGDPDMWRLANSIDGSGAWVEGDRVFNYFELHDEAWPLSGAGRMRAVKRIDSTWPHDDRYALGRTKLANGLTILAQGMPAILMGTEWAEDADWEDEKIDWSHKETYAGVFAFYRDVIGLRTGKRALFANSGCSVHHVNDGANVLAFERFGGDGRSYVVVANFSNRDFASYRVGVPRAGTWGVVMNSEDARYQGRGVGSLPGFIATSDEDRDGHGQSVSLELPAHGILLLQHEPEFIPRTVCDGDLDGDGDADVFDFAIFATSFGSSVGEEGYDRVVDFDGSGAVDVLDFGPFASDFGCGG